MKNVTKFHNILFFLLIIFQTTACPSTYPNNERTALDSGTKLSQDGSLPPETAQDNGNTDTKSDNTNILSINPNVIRIGKNQKISVNIAFNQTTEVKASLLLSFEKDNIAQHVDNKTTLPVPINVTKFSFLLLGKSSGSTKLKVSMNNKSLEATIIVF